MRYRRNTEEVNFWAGYADCMLALFMIALLLWILSAGITAFTDEDNASVLVTKEKQIAQLVLKISELEKIIEERDRRISELEQIATGLKGVENLLKEVERLRLDKIQLESKVAMLTAERDLLLAELKTTKKTLDEVLKENERLKGGLEGRDIESLLDKLEALEKELNDKPPVINLTAGAAEEFSFPAGKAEITDVFRDRLYSETFPELQKNLEKYKRVDTLEIIGHTDGRPINSQGNLDSAIPKLMDVNADKMELKPGSNTDLGLMRALAIRNAWLSWVDSKDDDDDRVKLKSIAVRCYSAAQTVPPRQIGEGFDWLAEDPSARRIEIRFIQLK